MGVNKGEFFNVGKDSRGPYKKARRDLDRWDRGGHEGKTRKGGGGIEGLSVWRRPEKGKGAAKRGISH